jgi:hypothetical protein
MTDLERKTIHLKVLRLLDERSALPWWAWMRWRALSRQMNRLLDQAFYS